MFPFRILYQRMEEQRQGQGQEHTQTWWVENAEARLDEFKNWVGDASAPSKVYMAEYLKERVQPYKTLLDAGCGTGTFYDTLRQRNLPISYTGADSCPYFLRMNRERGVQMLEADIRHIPVPDSTFDVAFSRHTFEHQSNVDAILLELIRVARQEACHIFFIKPLEGVNAKPIMNWDHITNLYHNTYTRSHIESLLSSHNRVSSWNWVEVNEHECALHVYLSS